MCHVHELAVYHLEDPEFVVRSDGFLDCLHDQLHVSEVADDEYHVSPEVDGWDGVAEGDVWVKLLD